MLCTKNQHSVNGPSSRRVIFLAQAGSWEHPTYVLRYLYLTETITSLYCIPCPFHAVYGNLGCPKNAESSFLAVSHQGNYFTELIPSSDTSCHVRFKSLHLLSHDECGKAGTRQWTCTACEHFWSLGWLVTEAVLNVEKQTHLDASSSPWYKCQKCIDVTLRDMG